LLNDAPKHLPPSTGEGRDRGAEKITLYLFPLPSRDFQ
jgi:hypothetical protein